MRALKLSRSFSRSSWLAALAITLIVASSIYSWAAVALTTNTFSGVLKDSDGMTYSGATVKLRDVNGNGVFALTASDGSFSVAVQPGMYSLSVSYAGHPTNGLYPFRLDQDTANPSIDLTSSNITQDLIIPTTTMNVSLYNDQGYPRSGYVVANTITSQPNGVAASVSLYPGGQPATYVYHNMSGGNNYGISVTSTANTATFKAITGTTYNTGVNVDASGICAYTSSAKTTLIGCNTTAVTMVNGTNNLAISRSPAATNTFSGTLKDSDGMTYSGVSVKLTDVYGNKVSSTTASDGSFSVAVQPGMYSLSLNYAGHPSGGLYPFTLDQGTSNPSIDLTSSNITQDLVIPTAPVSVSLYNDQGYPRSGYVVANTTTSGSYATPASVSLYPGGQPATYVYHNMSGGNNYGISVTSTANTATFKAIVGTTYGTTNTNSEICAYTSSAKTTLIGCNTAALTVTSSANNLVISRLPAPTNIFSGTLKDSDNMTYPNATIKLTDAYGNNVSSSVASDGSFSVAVQPGMYSLSVSYAGHPTNGLYPFTISQSTTNPSIDLTSGNIVQNLVIPTAQVSVSVYDNLGSPRAGFVVANTTTGQWGVPASVSLYAGGQPATFVAESMNSNNYGISVTSTANTATFKAILGTSYNTGVNVGASGICAYTNSTQTTLIGCNNVPFAVTSGANNLALPGPAAPTGLTAASPTSYPILSWQAAVSVQSYNIYRNGNKIGSSATTTFGDNNVANGTYNYQVSAVNSVGGESSLSGGVPVTVIQTTPSIETPSFSKNPVVVGESTTATIRVAGNLNGLIGGEYFIGNTDPGEGQGTSMLYNNGTLTATLSGLSEGIYTINFRAQNSVGWGPAVSTSIEVFKPKFSGTLKDSDGMIYPNAIVKLKGASGNTNSSTVAADGSFSVSVQPGMYSLSVSYAGHPTGGLYPFTLDQGTSNPSIDLTSSNITQDLVIPTASVDVSLYNDQGYPRSGYVTANTTTGQWGVPASVSLYAGGQPATFVAESMISNNYGINVTAGANTATFKAIVGTTYNTGVNVNASGICAYTNSAQTTLIGCNSSPLTVTSGPNSLVFTHAPVATNTFSGTLKDSDNVIYPNAIVKLTDAYGNKVSSTVASDGSFSVAVQPGMYSLSVSYAGHPINGLYPFRLDQDVATPSIDLTSNNVTKDLVIPTASVSVSLYDSLGSPRAGYVVANTTTGQWGIPASVSLYSGGQPATFVAESMNSNNYGISVTSTANTATFKAIVGTTYNTGVNVGASGICAYTNSAQATLIGCNNSPFTVTNSTNNLLLPQ